MVTHEGADNNPSGQVEGEAAQALAWSTLEDSRIEDTDEARVEAIKEDRLNYLKIAEELSDKGFLPPESQEGEFSDEPLTLQEAEEFLDIARELAGKMAWESDLARRNGAITTREERKTNRKIDTISSSLSASISTMQNVLRMRLDAIRNGNVRVDNESDSFVRLIGEDALESHRTQSAGVGQSYDSNDTMQHQFTFMPEVTLVDVMEEEKDGYGNILHSYYKTTAERGFVNDSDAAEFGISDEDAIERTDALPLTIHEREGTKLDFALGEGVAMMLYTNPASIRSRIAEAHRLAESGQRRPY